MASCSKSWKVARSTLEVIINEFSLEDVYESVMINWISQVGLGTLVYTLLDPKKNKKFREFITNDAHYIFGLNARDDTIIKMIDKKVKQNRVYIPSAFEGTWDGGVGIGRAVDYLDFLLYIVRTIVLPLVQNNETKCALMELVEGCSIAL
ncbi:hypothetical protein INT47_007002 [Mucor saturninus]|uniref:Uncharacterized protein n=1 Tax=Mucor saturninus TaxID=64648 RepID=A0A8H7QM35_9FUNG|nr:hypothetical protein INT47_007002 [Mucor saturninus]